MSDLQDRIQTATRTAMKARDKRLVAALRLVNAELKRLEVDERKALADADVIAVLTRMVKQRNDSRSQYEAAGRTDLAEQEAFEIDVVRSFMPTPLSEAEVDALIDAAIATTGAAGMRDMGKVMGQLKGEVAGRADMGTVSAKVKARLSG
ncbi:MAG: GatB/YqeY domain-containing protein [Gammaproteobacteria bacterium]|nr:GatB/YqeY domain-containing protein [Gammaproteobacteria bacterium]MYG11203.1 GatB/YqeY domain-containing protein [Gammaproteobacteria bacterium]MYK27351.1 GatB/YqeY domain-containing protein [Gammaproteobacteria bacterium]